MTKKIWKHYKESIEFILYQNQLYYGHRKSRDSSVDIATDYGLDDRMIGFRVPAGAEELSLRNRIQTGSGAHPTSYPMGTGRLFPLGVKRPGREADHSHPVPRSKNAWSYTSTLPIRLHGLVLKHRDSFPSTMDIAHNRESDTI
jgi:hypothetical protein